MKFLWLLSLIAISFADHHHPHLRHLNETIVCPESVKDILTCLLDKIPDNDFEF
jgi:hypothetical protein